MFLALPLDEYGDFETSLKVEGTSYTADDYLHGKCNNFAIVLSSITGLKSGGFFHVDISLDHEPLCLNHAYCILNDNYVIDIAGIRLLETVKEEYGHSDDYDYTFDDCLELLEKETRKGQYARFDKGERVRLRKHIKTYILPLIEQFKISSNI